MTIAGRNARIIGVLIIFQMVGSYLVNFVLEAPVFEAPGFLVNAASHSQQLGLAVLLGLVTEALWIGIAVTAFPIFSNRTKTVAILLVTLAVVVVAVAV